MRFLTGALAVLLVRVAYAFLLNLPHPPSVALGFAYGASALVLIAAARWLWCQTLYE
jgi:Na+/melibiose symporter-like transporter